MPLTDLEKLATIINKANISQSKKLDEIAGGLKNQKAPVVNMSVDKAIVPPIVIPEIKMPPFPAFPDYPPFPEVKVPEIRIPEIKVPQPIVNIKPPIVNIPPANITVNPKVDFPKTMKVEGIDDLKKELIEIKKKEVAGIDFPEIQNISGAVSIKNFPLTQDVTGLVTVENMPTETIKSIAGFEIPAHDTQKIDETDPNEVIIVYKKNGAIVATKTISVDGSLTTITIT